MTTISDIASMNTGNSTTGISSTISDSYDLFLSLLTTQVQNQDPLNPMDTAEYTSQLVEYSMVEQQIASNNNLELLLEQLKTQSASLFVGYIGNTVTAYGDSANLTNGEARWNYISDGIGTASVEIRNEQGAVVYSGETSITEGEGTYKWDGTLSSGGKAPDGVYSVQMSVVDETGTSSLLDTIVSGTVDEVDFSTGEIMLHVGGLTIPVGNITSVKQG
ncbi:flagellar hook capping protein [Rhodobacteraceae bacterium RKSG542]|uniref:flagellar hook assembly protein FlgD n=1 Tax=Pseudovibrio flavus TaxID=2529854 RepID=UPI0012BD66AD|nr:flagellar hook capping FlgD N-terminal domain-containing protein [Pseudovibrio flavus]MTI18974.1 flagellar hook capping protein [Pseudovibrio flavus]